MPQPQIDPTLYQEIEGGQEPQMTPEQMMAMQQQQMMPPQQPMPTQPQQPQQPEPQGEPDIEEAKKMLGIDQTQEALAQMQEKMKELEIEKTKSAVGAKYPDIPFDAVEKEIEKVKAINPQLADAMLTNPDAMEIAYKAVQASIKPQEEPDKITDGDGNGDADQNSELEERIKKGQANEAELGSFILSSIS